MEKQLFEDLLQSVNEAKAISQGIVKPSRVFEKPTLDVRVLREEMGLSQSEFAELFRVSVKTLQNWEQKRRVPTGPASVLLQVVANSPKTVLKSLHKAA